MFETLKKYKNPLLIIHGKKDTLIPYYHSQVLFDEALSDKRDIKLLENETHISVFFNENNVYSVLNFLEQF